MYQETAVKNDNEFVTTMKHFDEMQNEFGFQSVWSIYDHGVQDSDFAMLNKKLRQVVYEYVREDATTAEILADIDDGGKRASAQVTSWAVDGTIKSLWAAAESCIKQSGTHHVFIEDFELNEDGTLTLVTGS